jgi:hypothetical protein
LSGTASTPIINNTGVLSLTAGSGISLSGLNSNITINAITVPPPSGTTFATCFIPYPQITPEISNADTLFAVGTIYKKLQQPGDPNPPVPTNSGQGAKQPIIDALFNNTTINGVLVTAYHSVYMYIAAGASTCYGNFQLFLTVNSNQSFPTTQVPLLQPRNYTFITTGGPQPVSGGSVGNAVTVSTQFKLYRGTDYVADPLSQVLLQVQGYFQPPIYQDGPDTGINGYYVFNSYSNSQVSSRPQIIYEAF